MVLKHRPCDHTERHWFENDVKMYGTQTEDTRLQGHAQFENDVKMYGTQTGPLSSTAIHTFENDVKMYGTQTAAMT